MNNAHLHLVVNHLPIIFPIVGIFILLLGIFTKSDVTKRNSYLIFILGAIASIIAMATGQGAEETVENLPGVSEQLIKAHEEAAELFAAISYVLGGLSVLAWFADFKKLSFARFLPFAVLVMALGTLFFAQKAGQAGGEVRHTEIRSGNNLPQSGKSGTEHSGDED